MKKRDWNSFRGVPCTLIPHGHEGTAGMCQLESRDFERWSGEKRQCPPLQPKWQDISNLLLKSGTHLGSKRVGGQPLSSLQ